MRFTISVIAHAVDQARRPTAATASARRIRPAAGKDACATIALTLLPKLFYLKPLSLNQEQYLDPKDVKEIKAIISLMEKHDLSVFEIEKEGFRLKLEKSPSTRRTAAAPPEATSPTKGASTAPETTPAAPRSIETVPLKDIVSPMVGTFYCSASPDSPPFVDVGKSVTEDTVVCIIEAMKVMNEIKAETTGVVAEVVAENGKPVQFGQVLFRVR
ncbi:MAG: acetyl-CoA carboxylase biotin carboxyl carrier protein [Verrucomicrobia bacterium]|nr:MAG: acetyl-CoA carboxylase biotin carboxyl carrier protein [Verrucomicrobiota bacterium]